MSRFFMVQCVHSECCCQARNFN